MASSVVTLQQKRVNATWASCGTKFQAVNEPSDVEPKTQDKDAAEDSLTAICYGPMKLCGTMVSLLHFPIHSGDTTMIQVAVSY